MKKDRVIIKIERCSQNEAWYRNVRGVFESLPLQEHHQGKHHGNIYDLTSPGRGWVFENDVIVLKNNWWNRLRAKLNAR